MVVSVEGCLADILLFDCGSDENKCLDQRILIFAAARRPLSWLCGGHHALLDSKWDIQWDTVNLGVRVWGWGGAM